MTKDRPYLQHMLDMIGRIELATASGRAAFFESVIFQDAVLRNLHTLTETTQRLSGDLKSAHPEIEWAALAAFRNVVVHDYLGIDYRSGLDGSQSGRARSQGQVDETAFVNALTGCCLTRACSR